MKLIWDQFQGVLQTYITKNIDSVESNLLVKVIPFIFSVMRNRKL